MSFKKAYFIVAFCIVTYNVYYSTKSTGNFEFNFAKVFNATTARDKGGQDRGDTPSVISNTNIAVSGIHGLFYSSLNIFSEHSEIGPGIITCL